MFFTSDGRSALLVADEHAANLRADAAGERGRGRPGPRRALAASLRRVADRLEPSALAPRAA